MNSILLFTYPINILLMFAIPVLLAFFLTWRFKLGWRLWWIGAGTFVISQLGHIPFNLMLSNLFQGGILHFPEGSNQLMLNAILLGLSAGIWEECTRYASYRWWAKDARTWHKAILIGAGHGGIEAILLGSIALIAFLQLFALRNADLTQLFPVDQLELAQAQVVAYWSAPWFTSLLGAVERVFAIIAHISLSVLVLQIFLRGHIRWLWLAIGWHAFIDALAIYILSIWGANTTEAVLFIVTLINLALIFILSSPEPELTNASETSQLPAEMSISELNDVETTPESLEQTRYNL